MDRSQLSIPPRGRADDDEEGGGLSLVQLYEAKFPNGDKAATPTPYGEREIFPRFICISVCRPLIGCQSEPPAADLKEVRSSV